MTVGSIPCVEGCVSFSAPTGASDGPARGGRGRDALGRRRRADRAGLPEPSPGRQGRRMGWLGRRGEQKEMGWCWFWV